MLTAVNGYIDGNKVVVNENIADWQGRNVIVTMGYHYKNGISEPDEEHLIRMEKNG